MSTALYRLARWCVRRRGIVLAVWLVILASLGGGFAVAGGSTSGDITIPGTESQRALDTLSKEFPQASGATGTIVFKAPTGETLTTPAAKQLIGAATKEANALPGVIGAVDPYSAKSVSRDGRYALMSVQFAESTDHISEAQLAAYQQVGVAAENAGIAVARGGDVEEVGVGIGGAEAIGVAIALAVLVITLGSLLAAGMTMFTALLGVATGMLGLMLISNVYAFTSTTPVLALMLGLAVGIDYSLFITSRHKQHLAEGLDVEAAAGRAVGTAGSAVVFAGLTVIIALAALSVVGIPFLSTMGLAAAAAVAVAVLVAMTLLPALLGFIGPRLAGKVKAKPEVKAPFGFRWAKMIVGHRVLVIVLAVVTLGLLTVPAAGMRLALPDGSSAPVGSQKRAAYDMVAEGFGAGFNGPLAVVVFGDSPAHTQRTAADVARTVAGLRGVVTVSPPQPNESGDAIVLSAVPEAGPDSQATADLVSNIRDAVAPLATQGTDVAVTGSTALGIDVSGKLKAALPVYLLVVVGLSFLLLMLVFRSLLVPLKATAGFLLSVGATFGATVAVFQWGWLSSLIGLSSPGPLISFLPVLLIGILFGLAMDYEVFLVSRMREDYVHGASAAEAIVSGVGHGARIVTAAAIIMISVFAGFILVDDPIIKSMGFALAFGVLVDAFVVRQFLVPAVMSLLGDRAWWLPGWLDRVLPNVDIEGESLRARLAAAEPAPEPEAARVD